MTSPNYSSKTQCALFPSQDPPMTDLAYVHDFLKQFWNHSPVPSHRTCLVHHTRPVISMAFWEKSLLSAPASYQSSIIQGWLAAVCYCLNFSPSNYLWEWIFYNTSFIKVHPVITYHNTQITSEDKVMKLIKVPSQIDER